MFLAVEKLKWSYIRIWNFKKWIFFHPATTNSFLISNGTWCHTFNPSFSFSKTILDNPNLAGWLALYCHPIVSMTLDKLTIFLKQPCSGLWHQSVFWSLCIGCFKQHFVIMNDDECHIIWFDFYFLARNFALLQNFGIF